MYLPTRRLFVLMLDLNDRLGRPRTEESSDLVGDVGAGNEGDSVIRVRALLRRQSIAVPSTCHLATPIRFMVQADDHELTLLPHPRQCNSRASS